MAVRISSLLVTLHLLSQPSHASKARRGDSRGPYLELVAVPVPWLTGSIVAVGGTPREDQLSWDCSMDRQAEELSA